MLVCVPNVSSTSCKVGQVFGTWFKQKLVSKARVENTPRYLFTVYDLFRRTLRLNMRVSVALVPLVQEGSFAQGKVWRKLSVRKFLKADGDIFPAHFFRNGRYTRPAKAGWRDRRIYFNFGQNTPFDVKVFLVLSFRWRDGKQYFETGLKGWMRLKKRLLKF